MCRFFPVLLSVCCLQCGMAASNRVEFPFWTDEDARTLDVPTDGSVSKPLVCASEVLDQVTGFKMTGLSLIWSATTIKAQRSAGMLSGVLAFCSTSDGREIFTIPVDNVVAYETKEVPLPVDRAVVTALRDGATVQWHGMSGKLEKFTLNLNVRHPRTNGIECQMRLKVVFEEDGKRLAFDRKTGIVDDAFVTVDSAGDLVYRGEKLRLSGVNLGQPRTREAADSVMKRLIAMNVNAVRLWETYWYAKDQTNATPQFTETALVDAYDYFVSLCRKNNIFIHVTALGSHVPPPETEFKDMGRNVSWVFPEGTRRLREHALRFANHVNPYLGKRNCELSVFATYELQNEDTFIADLLQRDAKGYGGKMSRWTEEHRARFHAMWLSWLERKHGKRIEREFGPLFGDEKGHDESTRSDALQFLLDLQCAAFDEICAACRSAAPTGIGLNVAPIVHGTHATLNMNAQYVHSRGDGAAVGIYQSPYTHQKNAAFYPYAPYVAHRPYFWNLNMQTVDNKFFMVYEHHPHGPYKYRAEWMPVLTALGAGLGWDAMYFYAFGNSSRIRGAPGLSYAGAPMPEPTSTGHDGYCHYFHGSVDEIMMGGLAVCGQAFINGIARNSTKTVVSYGPKAYRDTLWRSYSPGDMTRKFSEGEIAELTGGGVEEYFTMPEMYRRLMQNAVRHELALRFDQNQKMPLLIEGAFDSVARPADDKTRLEPSPDITWDTPNARLVVDNAKSAIAVGVLPELLKFRSGVSFRSSRRLPFAFFGVATRDGKPFETSADIMLNVSSDAENTGYRLNPDKMRDGALALIPAIEDRGRAPVIVMRPSGKVVVPGPAFTLERYNFAGYCYKTEEVTDGTFCINEGEPIFIARLLRGR